MVEEVIVVLTALRGSGFMIFLELRVRRRRRRTGGWLAGWVCGLALSFP
jgi:hypothetical protein